MGGQVSRHCKRRRKKRKKRVGGRYCITAQQGGDFRVTVIVSFLLSLLLLLSFFSLVEKKTNQLCRKNSENGPFATRSVSVLNRSPMSMRVEKANKPFGNASRCRKTGATPFAQPLELGRRARGSCSEKYDCGSCGSGEPASAGGDWPEVAGGGERIGSGGEGRTEGRLNGGRGGQLRK